MTQGERPRAVPRLSLLLVTMTRSKDKRDILECRFFQSYNRHIQEKGGTPYADHIQNPCRSLCAGADPACGRALVPAESFRWLALHPRVGAGAAECPDAVCGERHFHGDRGAADGVCYFALWPARAGRMAACQAGRAERFPAGLHHRLSSGHGGQKMQKTAADPIRRLSYGKEGCLRPQPTSNLTSGPISGRPCKA